MTKCLLSHMLITGTAEVSPRVSEAEIIPPRPSHHRQVPCFFHPPTVITKPKILNQMPSQQGKPCKKRRLPRHPSYRLGWISCQNKKCLQCQPAAAYTILLTQPFDQQG